MGNADSLPDRVNEEQAKELAGELWNQPIFDSLKDDNGLALKQDILDSASEALMACQGESNESRVIHRKKKSIRKHYKTNMEYGKSVYNRLLLTLHNGPQVVKICSLAHLGELDDLVAYCEDVEPSKLNVVDMKLERTALQIASTYNFLSIAKHLIDKGCDVNVQNKELRTAMHYASQIGNWEMVALLLESGANPDLKDYKGRYPGDYAESDYSFEGYVQQDTEQMSGMKDRMRPQKAGAYLYNGPRIGNENDPPSAEVVAVEITNAGHRQKRAVASSRSITTDASSASTRSIRRTALKSK